jgi:hypothetical protein
MNRLNRLWGTCSTGLFLFFLSAAVIFLASCAGTGNYGRLAPNDNVKKTFETYQLPPNHTYYYSGSDASPRALIGIRNEYHLKSKFWKPVELTQKLLKRWLERGHTRVGYNLTRNGSEILAPDGSQIGIWYAVKNWKDRATVKMIDEKTVNVSTPLDDKSRRKRDIDKDK